MRLATRVQMALGAPVVAPPPPVYDATIDVATGWWAPPYAAASWAAKASAGTSGAAGPLTDASYPAVGVIGGLNGADFSAHKLGNANAISTFISAAAYSVEAVFKTDTVYPRATGAAYSEPAFITDDTNGFFYFTRCDGYVVLGHYDGASFKEIIAACPLDGAIHTAQGWFDGTNLNLVVDNGTPATPVAAGNVTSGGGAGLLRVGANYTGLNQYDGTIGEVRVAALNHGPTARTGWLSYVNDKYSTAF